MIVTHAEHAALRAIRGTQHSCRLHGHIWQPQEDMPRDPDAHGDIYLECEHCQDTEYAPELVRQFIAEREEAAL